MAGYKYKYRFLCNNGPMRRKRQIAAQLSTILVEVVDTAARARSESRQDYIARALVHELRSDENIDDKSKAFSYDILSSTHGTGDKTLYLRIPRHIHAALKKGCHHEGRPFVDYIIDVLERGVWDFISEMDKLDIALADDPEVGKNAKDPQDPKKAKAE